MHTQKRYKSQQVMAAEEQENMSCDVNGSISDSKRIKKVKVDRTRKICIDEEDS